jgi:hypothetical protein
VSSDGLHWAEITLIVLGSLAGLTGFGVLGYMIYKRWSNSPIALSQIQMVDRYQNKKQKSAQTEIKSQFKKYPATKRKLPV